MHSCFLQDRDVLLPFLLRMYHWISGILLVPWTVGPVLTMRSCCLRIGMSSFLLLLRDVPLDILYPPGAVDCGSCTGDALLFQEPSFSVKEMYGEEFPGSVLSRKLSWLGLRPWCLVTGVWGRTQYWGARLCPPPAPLVLLRPLPWRGWDAMSPSFPAVPVLTVSGGVEPSQLLLLLLFYSLYYCSSCYSCSCSYYCSYSSSCSSAPPAAFIASQGRWICPLDWLRLTTGQTSHRRWRRRGRGRRGRRRGDCSAFCS